MAKEDIQLINDGDGVAVIGEAKLVDEFLAQAGLRAESLQLGRVNSAARRVSGATQMGAAFMENSGRWVKLTEESAGKLRQFGPSLNKNTGLMTGVVRADKGRIASHLQFVPVAGASAFNPVTLTVLAAVMAQQAMDNQMNEISDYLEQIDRKLDDVLRAQKDSVLAKLDGVKFLIDDAVSVWNDTHHLNSVTWSKVQASAGTIAETQAYALRQIDAAAGRLEQKNRVGELAGVVREVEATVNEWLYVLAETFRLQDALVIVELEHVFNECPDEVDVHRAGLNNARQRRVDHIAASTERLLAQMHEAAEMSDYQVVFNPRHSRTLVESSNNVAGDIVSFQRTLGIERKDADIDGRTWRAALGGIRDEAVGKGAQGVKGVRRFGGRAVDDTKQLTGRVKENVGEQRTKRLQKRIDRLTQKRSELLDRGQDPDREPEDP